MKLRKCALLLTCLSSGCVDAPGAELLAPPVATPISATSVLQVTRTTLSLENIVQLPCTVELMHVSGNLQIELLSRALGSDRYQIRYTVEATSVTGQAQLGDVAYRVQGAASGMLTTSHRDRAITTADFKLIVTSPPGIEVGRARAPSVFSVIIAFPVSEIGLLREPLVESVFVPKDCPR